MSGCCGEADKNVTECSPCSEPEAVAPKKERYESIDQIKRFDSMVKNSIEFAEGRKEQGHPIVGIMCEYTPREIIMAAGGTPACLCGGFQETIPAAEEELPANLCPLIKSTYGFSLLKQNPFLEGSELLVAETTCDGKKKMYELMGRRHPMHVLELPQKADSNDSFELWVAELYRLKESLEEKFNTTITDEKLREAIKLMNRERGLRRELASLMKSDNPPLCGKELLKLKAITACNPDDLDAYEEIITELKKQGPREENGGVRILLTGVPTAHGAEKVVNIIEETGATIVAQENCTGLKPIMTDIDENAEDLIRAIGEKYFSLPCSVMTENKGRIELLRELCKEYRVDAVIDLSWHACLTYDIESVLVKKLVEDELDLPFLRISTDYSPNDAARISLRVQALVETAKTASVF